MRGNNQQQLDTSDPYVRAFLAECGAIEHAVSLRLIGVTLADVQMVITRLESKFGRSIALTQPRQSGRGEEWIAYGTFTE